MFGIIVVFFVGIILGWFLRKKKKIKKWVQLVTNIDLCLLLFVLGLNVGRQDELIHQLDSIGIQSLLLASGAVLGSILFVLPISKRIVKG